MSLFQLTFGRTMAIAAITAGALAIGAGTASAEPAAPQQPQPAATQQLTTATDTAAHTVSATLASGRFVANDAARAIDITDAAGAVVESIPLAVHDTAVPVSAVVSNDGQTLTLKQIAFTDTANQLINQWVWGVQNGGAVGAIVGCLLGFWLFVIPGCAIGAAIGGALTSPNSGEINATFNRLLTGN